MAYKNRVCKYCGRKYYVCLACHRSGSWRTLCCSRECYLKYIAASKDKENNGTEPNYIDEGESKISGVLKTGEEEEILGYDLQANRFDCESGKTRAVQDFTEFRMDSSEMRNIIDQVQHLAKEENPN